MPRTKAVFSAWNEREIVILGGIDSNRNYLGDGWVFDSTNHTFRQVIYPVANSLKIYADDNQSFKSGESSVIAKVIYGKGSKNDACIIEFDKESTQLRIYKNGMIGINKLYEGYGNEDDEVDDSYVDDDYGFESENEKAIYYSQFG